MLTEFKYLCLLASSLVSRALSHVFLSIDNLRNTKIWETYKKLLICNSKLPKFKIRNQNLFQILQSNLLIKTWSNYLFKYKQIILKNKITTIMEIKISQYWKQDIYFGWLLFCALLTNVFIFPSWIMLKCWSKPDSVFPRKKLPSTFAFLIYQQVKCF